MNNIVPEPVNTFEQQQMQGNSGSGGMRSDPVSQSLKKHLNFSFTNLRLVV